MGKSKDYFLERAANIFDLPGEVVAGMSRVTLTGGSRVFIENHKGILEYTDVEVKINAGKNILRITGNRLVVNSMTANQLKLGGNIDMVQFIGV